MRTCTSQLSSVSHVGLAILVFLVVAVDGALAARDTSHDITSDPNARAFSDEADSSGLGLLPTKYGADADTYFSNHPAARGARIAMATIYQSCKAIQGNPITKGEDYRANGVTLTNKARRTSYGDKDDIISSHPYIDETASYEGCYDVLENPPVYNYGAKPKEELNGRIDLHARSGTGNKSVAGIDCSGFVAAAFARMGLKMSASQGSFNGLAQNTSAAAMGNPERNGLSCLATVPFDHSVAPIQSGDVLGWNGHVVMVESVEEDPFGIAFAQSPADCTAGNISSSTMNFTIIQSSATNNGVGVNRMKAADYFNGSEIVNIAISACLAQFDSGEESELEARSGSMGLVRHDSQKEGCTTAPKKFENEECVSGCT